MSPKKMGMFADTNNPSISANAVAATANFCALESLVFKNCMSYTQTIGNHTPYTPTTRFSLLHPDNKK